jgi:hypothetical protein
MSSDISAGRNLRLLLGSHLVRGAVAKAHDPIDLDAFALGVEQHDSRAVRARA